MKKLSVQLLIEKLGFSNSENLVYSDNINSSKISKHDIKILNAINPYAIYLMNNKPFFVFIEASLDTDGFRNISKLIWNAQIPVAFLCDSNSVRLFNGKNLDMKSYLVKEISKGNVSDFSLESDFSYLKISDPLFWDQYTKAYNGSQLNDYLLDNITSLTNELKNKYKIPFATKLVLRLIFIRYLIDRGVNLDYKNFVEDIEKSKRELSRLTKDKSELYELFKYLKIKFNGNLFELGNETGGGSLTAEALKLLSDFLSADISLGNGQFSLFSMYDFNIIPVELISNIYEILLGKEIRNKDNAFYTPNYLAEYVLDKTTLKTLQQNRQYKILDPACGSGVFLINSFRRMIDTSLQDSIYCEDDDFLKDLLQNNIYGVDINNDAIDVTIFSLYLTILDYKDPKTLSGFKLPNLKGCNLFVSDFFDDNKLEPLKEIKFDFIIGNPPWGSVTDGKHLSYCDSNGYSNMQQNKEISRSFVFRAKDFSSVNTVCCFVLHSKLLYTQKNPSKEFRKFLLSKTKILNITEMSSVRKLVFKNADAPATVIAFQYNNSGENLNHKIEYTSLKPNVFFKLFNIIVIEKYDVKYVPQKLLFENDWAWKTIVYGFSADVDMILSLKNKFKSVLHIIRENNLEYGRGIEVHDGDKQDATHLQGRILVNAKQGIEPFHVNLERSAVFSKKAVHRAKEQKQEIFKAPLSVVKKGFNTKTFKYRSAYSEKEFIYPDAVTGICGTENDKTTLLCLTAIFNSSFYAYLNLMLGSSSGIEREQGFPTEIFQYPAIINKEIAQLVMMIQEEIIKEQEIFCNVEKSGELIKSLDTLVLQSFNLNTNSFIDYALNIQIPELTNSKEPNIYREVMPKDLVEYSECFNTQFSSVYSKFEKSVVISLYPKILNRFTVFELEIIEGTNQNQMIFKEESDCNKELFTSLIRHDYNDLFHQIKDVMHFSENSFYIIKPNNYKYWHPAIAEMDLADIFNQILTDTGGEEL